MTPLGRARLRLAPGVAALALWASCVSAGGAPAQVGQPNPPPVSRAPAAAVPAGTPGSATTISVVLAGGRTAADLFLPDTEGPVPVVVVAHGFSRTRATMRGWGPRLAAAGYLAAVPDLPARSDHARNGTAITDLLRQLEAGAAGRPVDATREAVVGFSAGGLASVLAAAAHAGVALWVGLDPVDRGGAGAAAAATRSFPAVLLTAAPSACNAHGNGAGIAASLKGPWLSLAVAGASHCDPESPGSRLCGMICAGGWTEARHAVFADYTTAALDAVLRCRPEAWERLDAARADPRITRVTGPGLEPLRRVCAGPRP